MNHDSAPGGLIAVIGKKEALHAPLSAAFAGWAVFSEDIPYYPGLSVRDNAAQLRMMLPEEKAPRFEAMLKLTGLQKDGWARPFRKDMAGQKRLFGLLEAMLLSPKALLVYDLQAGMEAKQREAFADMAAYYREGGGTLAYTSMNLKDVLRLALPQEIWLPAPDGFTKTDAEALRAKLAAESPEQADALIKRMEAGEAW